MKPDVVAPGTSITSLSDDWEFGGDYRTGSGGSFATPHVAGLLAQQIEFGRANALSIDPRVLKATVMNSADKVADKAGNPWEQAGVEYINGTLTVTQPLDTDSGAGQINAMGLFTQYSTGEQNAGMVRATGWDFAEVLGDGFVDYIFDRNLLGGSLFTATLTWYRHVTRFDDGDGIIDSGDSFAVQALDDLDLELLLDGSPVAMSVSAVDNVEHLHFALPETGAYTLRVSRDFVNGSGAGESFDLAWSATAIPELLTAAALAPLAVLALRRRRLLV